MNAAHNHTQDPRTPCTEACPAWIDHNHSRQFKCSEACPGKANDPNPPPDESYLPKEAYQFKSGAQRQLIENVRFDLIGQEGLHRLAMVYAEGAKRYGDHNWRKGFPFSDTMNHAMRHLNLYMNGDRREDHLAKAAWGMFAIMEFEHTRPRENDLIASPKRPTPGDTVRDPSLPPLPSSSSLERRDG